MDLGKISPGIFAFVSLLRLPMNLWESFLLGLVQGLGEFLPISSSAHLVILPWLVKFKDPGLAFDVALHLGTLLAVIAYFWNDWWLISKGSCQYISGKRDKDSKFYFYLLVYLVLATIPAALAGVFLDKWAETIFRKPWLVAINMLVLGLILFWVDKRQKTPLKLNNIKLKEALIIGFAQCLALLPGVSRSGVTITTALMLGLNRVDAARFSFLMATPIIFGACIYKYKYFMSVIFDPLALFGIAVAAITGFLSIKYLLKLVKNYSYAVFCYYRFFFALGVGVVYVLRS